MQYLLKSVRTLMNIYNPGEILKSSFEMRIVISHKVTFIIGDCIPNDLEMSKIYKSLISMPKSKYIGI
jgi:hypothetical protein